MPQNLQKIEPADVELGMFIVGFGGGWFDHPFWKRRFLLERPEDLDQIQRSAIPYVEIDAALGKSKTDSAPAQRAGDETTPPALAATIPNKNPRLAKYVPASEHKTKALVDRSAQMIRSVYDQLEMGWRVDGTAIEGVLDDIEQEIERDAQTLLKVVRLKSKDDYTYLHSISVCTLMVCVGRLKGLDREDVRKLGLAGLLHDIGKVSIPDAILKKPGRLSDCEFASVKRHPEKGFELLSTLPNVPEMALDVCLHHHEKIDGTGYPHGLARDEISFEARLGAVCDVFDALTSHRAYKEPWSRQKALNAMWSWEGHFDRDLLFDLMQVVHVYASGLLVRLSTGALAMTLPTDPLSVTVPVREFYCTDRREWITPREIRIMRGDANLAIVGLEQPEAWGLEPWEETLNRVYTGHSEATMPACA